MKKYNNSSNLIIHYANNNFCSSYGYLTCGWLLWTIYRKDIVHPEPTKWLMKVFAYGVLSVFLSFVVSIPMSLMLNIDIDRQVYSSIQEAITDSFLLVAIPEELSKFFVLWLLLRKNPFFNEHFDGIIYAVCVGLGLPYWRMFFIF